MFSQYNQKKTDLQGCLNLIRSGDNICFAGGCNQPAAFMKSFHTIAPRVENVECIKSRSGDYEFITAPGMNGHINTGSPLYGEAFNEGMKHGNTSFIVCDMCDYSRFVSEHKPCNTFVAAVSPMDEGGYFQVGLSQMWEKECIETCSKIILEVNENLPRVNGGLDIHISRVTAFHEATYPCRRWWRMKPPTRSAPLLTTLPRSSPTGTAWSWAPAPSRASLPSGSWIIVSWGFIRSGSTLPPGI